MQHLSAIDAREHVDITRAAIIEAIPAGEMERIALTMRSMTTLRMLMVFMIGSAWGPREESTTAKNTEKEMMPRMLKSAAALTGEGGRVWVEGCRGCRTTHLYVGGCHAFHNVEQAEQRVSQATP